MITGSNPGSTQVLITIPSSTTTITSSSASTIIYYVLVFLLVLTRSPLKLYTTNNNIHNNNNVKNSNNNNNNHATTTPGSPGLNRSLIAQKTPSNLKLFFKPPLHSPLQPSRRSNLKPSRLPFQPLSRPEKGGLFRRFQRARRRLEGAFQESLQGAEGGFKRGASEGLKPP